MGRWLTHYGSHACGGIHGACASKHINACGAYGPHHFCMTHDGMTSTLWGVLWRCRSCYGCWWACALRTLPTMSTWQRWGHCRCAGVLWRWCSEARHCDRLRMGGFACCMAGMLSMVGLWPALRWGCAAACSAACTGEPPCFAFPLIQHAWRVQVVSSLFVLLQAHLARPELRPLAAQMLRCVRD